MLKKVLLALALVSTSALAEDTGQIGNLNTPAVTCAATATLMAAARYRSAITVVAPSGGATVYIGSTNAVTTANGFPIVAGAALTLQPYNGAIYCIVSTGTQTANVAETY